MRSATTTAVLWSWLLAGELPAQDMPDRVVIAAPQVDVRVNGKVVDRVSRGQVFQVTGVQGPWLWIRHRRSGWIDKSLVMPLNQAAVGHFSTSIRAQPGVAGNYHARGNIWSHLGRLDQAVADFGAAIRLDPNRSASLINRGLAQHRLGNYDLAIADYDAAIRIEVSNPIAHNNRGLAHFAKGQFQEAVKDYSEALRLEADYVVAHTNRGAALAALGDYRAALQDFERALEIDPRNAVDYSNRAWLRATCPSDEFRDGKRAVTDASRASKLAGPGNRRNLEILAAAYAEGGNFKQAVKTLRAAIEINGPQASELQQKMLESFLARRPWRDRPASAPASAGGRP